MTAIRNSSSERYYYPGKPEREAIARSRRQQQRIEETVDLQRRFSRLNDWAMSKGAWLTSLPGHREVTIETLVGSTVPDELRASGYQLEEIEGGERIIPAMRADHVLIEGNTVGAIRTLREGIVAVRRFMFAL
jgi:hypothetical protein